MSTFPPPALYAASARETSPLYFFKFCAISLAPPIIFCCASYAFVTPSPFAVDGISCMTPMAPAELVADGLKLDSCLAMALSRLISTPYVSEASLKYSSRFSGEETLPEEVVLFVAEELEIAGVSVTGDVSTGASVCGVNPRICCTVSRETAPLLLAASSASTAMACTLRSAEARHSLNVVTASSVFFGVCILAEAASCSLAVCV